MTETKMLGNQEEQKGIEKLLKQAGQDKVIEGIVKGEDTASTAKEDFFRRFAKCKKADKLISAIVNSKFYDKKKRLLKKRNAGSNNSYYFTGDNLSTALAYLAAGNKKEAGNMIESLISVNGSYKNKGELIVNANYKNDAAWNISDNSFLILAYLGIGEKEKAIKQYESLNKNINKHVSFGEICVNTEKTITDVHSLPNASYALASYALGNEKEAECIMNYIIGNIPKKDSSHSFEGHKICPELYVDGVMYWEVYSENNALIALAKMIINENLTGASRIIQGIEKHIEFNQETGLINRSTDPFFNEHHNLEGSALLALAYMAQEFLSSKQKK